MTEQMGIIRRELIPKKEINGNSRTENYNIYNGKLVELV